MAKILVVDDDIAVADSVQEILEQSGFLADQANSTEDADALLRGFEYDLLILDWVLPGMHGIDFLASIRKNGMNMPVLMLTGQSSLNDKITGLETGADDYLTKPFEPKELVARVKALMRRPQVVASKQLCLANVVLDLTTQRVFWHENELKLTRQEYLLLELLMKHKNETFSHDALVERAWSSMSEASPDTVRTHMSRLRKKFELASKASKCPIKTLHGKGYVFSSD